MFCLWWIPINNSQLRRWGLILDFSVTFLCDLTSSNNIVMFWFLLWITRIMTESHLAWNEQHWDTASPKLAEQLEKAIRAGSSSSGGVRQLTPIPAGFQANFSMTIYPQALTREQQPTPEYQGSPQTCTTLPGLFCLHPAVRDLPAQLWPDASAATTVCKITPFLSVMSEPLLVVHTDRALRQYRGFNDS